MELKQNVLRNIPFSRKPEVSDPDHSNTMSCSGGCGRFVVKPTFLQNAKIQGKINVLCPHCSKRNAKEQEWTKRKEKANVS